MIARYLIISKLVFNSVELSCVQFGQMAIEIFNNPFISMKALFIIVGETVCFATELSFLCHSCHTIGFITNSFFFYSPLIPLFI